jgi:NDP-sugar pyrophosphorylase family protein
VILAGGKATRLRPYTDDRPKILVEIAGRPILDRQVEWLAGGGIEHLVISSGYLTNVLSEYVAAHDFPLHIEVLAEDEPLGRGGGLKYAAGALAYPDEDWLGLNGDILTDLSIPDIHDAHTRFGAKATVAVARFRSPYGIVEIGGSGAIENFAEAPMLPHWVNAGVYVFAPELRQLLPDRGDHETSTFPALVTQGQLWAYRITGYWRGVDTVKDINDATRELAAASS